MALHSSSSGMFSLKNIAILSTGVLSFALLLKLSIPLSDYAVSELPSVYSAVISWLRPPYLYLVINCIIICIMASSKLQQQPKANDVTALSSSSSHVFVQSTDEFVKEVVGESCGEFYQKDLHMDQTEVVEEKEGVVEEKMAVKEGEFYQEGLHVEQAEVVEEKEGVVEEKVAVKEVGQYDERVVLGEKLKERSDSIDMLWNKVELRKENKPPASARFGHKKSLKASSPEVGKGGGLGVTRSKRHDTLESTWKMITDGRPMPLTRHLKKSETWDTDERSAALPLSTNKPMKKSETFGETKSKRSEQNREGFSGRLKREPSLSQDELNKRVEAFINKFNEEMRLQRQQSLNQYQEMIAREAY